MIDLSKFLSNKNILNGVITIDYKLFFFKGTIDYKLVCCKTLSIL